MSNIPVYVRWVSYLIPARYYIEVARDAFVRGVLLKGVGHEVLYSNLLALTAFMFVIVGASVWRFRKRLS